MDGLIRRLVDKALDRALDFIVFLLVSFFGAFVSWLAWPAWRAIVGGVIASLIVLCVLQIIRREIRKASVGNRRKAAIKRAVASLDQSEWSVLVSFTQSQRNTLPLPFDDPTVSGLVTKGVLLFTSRNGELVSVRE